MSDELGDMESDWLEEAEPTAEDWLDNVDPQDIADAAGQGDAADAPIEVDSPLVPAVNEERNALINQTWASLTISQKTWLEWAEKDNFNYEATKRRIRRLSPSMYVPSRNILSRWRRQPAYKLIESIVKSAAAHEALDKNNVVLTAAQIREQAMKPKPILYQGQATGHFEFQGDVALRANEQLAKLGGLLKQEDVQTGNQGPALIVQVIQGGGQVIDVTPRGTVINLPAPDHGA